MAYDGGPSRRSAASPFGDIFDLSLQSAGARPRSMMRGIGAFMMLKGSAVLEVNGVRCALRADDIALVNDGDIYSLSSDASGAPDIALAFRVFRAYLERECPETLDFRYDCNSAAQGSRLAAENKFFGVKRSLVRMMLARYKRDDGYALEARRALMDLLHEIYMNFRAIEAKPASKGESRGDSGGIREAVSYIHENYRYGVSLAGASARAGMSPHYFSRRFKQKMGLGFLEYLNKIRLDGAVRDLLGTDESILKIAMNNGFSGSKPFTALFKKTYSQTPQSYKQKEAGRKRAGKAAGDERAFSVGERDGLESLLRYIAIYDISHGEGTSGAPVSATVPLAPLSGDLPGPRGIPLPGKIFKIGRLSEAIDSEVKEQLAEAQKRLRGDYIYFRGIFDDGISRQPDGSFFRKYDYSRVFSFFMELGLTPFVSVDLSLPRAGDAPPGKLVSEFLAVMLENRPAPLWRSGIRIEVLRSGETAERGAAQTFAEEFGHVYRAAKAFSPGIGVGFHSLSSSRPGERERLAEKMSACGAAGIAPDFLSITVDPSLEDGVEPSYGSIKNYGARQVEEAMRVYGEIFGDDGANRPQIYVTEWNTLSGRTSIESSAFFRAALIASDLLSFGRNVSAAAYWLNSKSKETLTDKVDNRVLALYFHGLVRRPPFYALYMANKLEGRAVYQSDRLVVTSPGPGEYAALFMNPRYFDPLYSLEDAYVAMERIRVEAEVTGIPKGLYRLKVFVFEKKHSSAFDRLSKVGLMSLNDEDMTVYLEHAILPEFNVFEEEINSTYTFAPNLGYNGVALYLFKKIG
ncbi:MAG: helix-turn-helix domain-containing protein [Synergistaceae bacterium]|jgi:AraC-like DNA-binding protein/beta-xylosidase|nr:helix-turn-helix domain-containing protein [Synergistaceae bacterium]